MAYAFRAPCTIDHTRCGASDSADFPVLVDVTDDRLKAVALGGQVRSALGYDVAPYSDAGLATRLDFEAVTLDLTAGHITLWARQPVLSSTLDGTLHLGVGDGAIVADQSHPHGVWDTAKGWLGVYHLSTDGGVTLDLHDSTVERNDGTPINGPTAAAGIVGGAVSLDADLSQAVSLGSAMNPPAVSVALWANPVTGLFGYRPCFIREDDADAFTTVYFNASANRAAYYGGDNSWVDPGTQPVAPGAWSRLVLIYGPSAGTRPFTDGVKELGDANSAYDGPLSTNPAETLLGPQFGGLLSEVRVSSVEWSDDWAIAEAAQYPGSGFLSVGDWVSPPPPQPRVQHFASYAGNLQGFTSWEAD